MKVSNAVNFTGHEIVKLELKAAGSEEEQNS